MEILIFFNLLLEQLIVIGFALVLVLQKQLELESTLNYSFCNFFV